jgi:hypothetical protein
MIAKNHPCPVLLPSPPQSPFPRPGRHPRTFGQVTRAGCGSSRFSRPPRRDDMQIVRRLRQLEAATPCGCPAGERYGGWLPKGRQGPWTVPALRRHYLPRGPPCIPGHVHAPTTSITPLTALAVPPGRLRQTALSRAWRDLDLRHWQPVPQPRDPKYWYLPDRRAVPADGLGPLSTTWLLEPVSNTPRPHMQPTLARGQRGCHPTIG